MTEAAPEATPADPDVTPPVDPGTPPPAAPPADPAPATDPQSVEQLPDWAQKLVRDARKEAGDHRQAAKTAADAARQEILQKLGLTQGEDKPDPEALARDIATARQEAADRARELAIYKAAGAHGADPAKLLDSNSFMTSVKGLDPADGDAVANAIKAAVTANQSLKAARAAAASGVELSGGTGEQGQITEQQLKTMKPEEIVQAQAKGLLRNLLG